MGDCRAIAQAPRELSAARRIAGVRAKIVRCGSRSRSSTRCVGDLAGNARAHRRTPIAHGRAPAPTSSSRPSCRSAAIRPRTCVLRPASSTRARAELAALAAHRRRASTCVVGFPAPRRRARATTRWRCCATAASQQVYSQAVPAQLHGLRRGALLRAGRPRLRVRRRRACAAALIICEDIWFPEPAAQAQAAGAQVLVVPNGSPYHTRQQALRREQVGARARENGAADRLREPRRRPGRARVRRRVVRRRRAAARSRSSCRHGTRRSRSSSSTARVPRPCAAALDADARGARLRRARDGRARLRRQERFPGVLLGLSGGIDSALTLAIAVDALGRDARARA